ncbi:MAG: molybdenum cofactor guanylyltransferase [Cyanobacteria bacterium P01_A01_bin.105]
MQDNQDIKCAALILAGGRSTRMGQDKGLLVKDSQTLIASACTAAQACTTSVHLLTPWPDRYRPHIPKATTLHPEIQPATGATGPLVALAKALGQLPTDLDWLLLLACDWVGLSTQTLVKGRQQLVHLPQDTLAYLPRTPKGWEPLHGFYRLPRLRQELPRAVAQGTRAFQPWLATIPVTIWPVDMTRLINCNTPTDWQHAAQIGGRDSD